IRQKPFITPRTTTAATTMSTTLTTGAIHQLVVLLLGLTLPATTPCLTADILAASFQLFLLGKKLELNTCSSSIAQIRRKVKKLLFAF
ncbi:MAG: hypothetical protein WC519_00005, partial [Parcubacteria group bacterium]